MYKSEIIRKSKPPLDEMWKFIDAIMNPHILIPNKSSLSSEQVYFIYSRLVQIDETFRELEQISIFKKRVRGSEQ